MTDQQEQRAEALHELEAWLETPMLVLSLVWLVIVIVELTWRVVPLIEIVILLIWAVFVIEFAVRLALAPAKGHFVAQNWLTLLALLLPAFRMLAVVRVVRFIPFARGLTLVRVVGTANRSMNALRRGLSRRGLGYVALLTLAVVLLGAAGMLALEPAGQVEGGFRGYGDALWWTAMLLTTMGTDFWPRTAEGRMLCLLLAMYGFAVFGYITAALAAFFVGQEHGRGTQAVLTSEETEHLRRDMLSLRRLLETSLPVPGQGPERAG